MAVPVAAVHEEREPVPGQDDVRPAWEASLVDPETEALGVQPAAHLELGASVAALVGLHDFAGRVRDGLWRIGGDFDHDGHVAAAVARRHQIPVKSDLRPDGLESRHEARPQGPRSSAMGRIFALDA